MLEFEILIKRVSEAIKRDTDKQIDLLSKEFNTPIQNIVATQWVHSNCSDIIFINYTPLGTANGNVQVNNYILQPGGFVSFGGNNAEINRDTYNVVFGSAATNCVVIKKLYIKA
jgi:hypothetical protein